jgi:hypothetical protein
MFVIPKDSIPRLFFLTWQGYFYCTQSPEYISFFISGAFFDVLVRIELYLHKQKRQFEGEHVENLS